MDKNVIREYIKNNKRINYHFDYEEDSGKVKLFNDEGYEIDPKIALALAEELNHTYKNMSEYDLNEIKKQNAENEYWHYTLCYGPNSLETAFRKNLKRKWSFSCKNCGKKVSSDKDKSWWRISGPNYESSNKYCSKKCIDPIISDIRSDLKASMYKSFDVQ
ncbi:hypothetical protein [Jeotgalibacillus malaysiensis]|uniref:hypothetical protein n=1 Tax=Jeotgalibacillus malaysiensis TaxID=1508404 RepID=UPI00384CE8BB